MRTVVHSRVSAGGKQNTPTPASLSIVLKFMVFAQVSVFFGKWENTEQGLGSHSTRICNRLSSRRPCATLLSPNNFAIISSATFNETSNRKLLSPRVSSEREHDVTSDRREQKRVFGKRNRQRFEVALLFEKSEFKTCSRGKG